MNQEKREHFIQTLIEERKKKKKSIQQVSDATRIAPQFIQAIEDNEYSKLPKGYAKLFVKSYLNYLSLDNEENLAMLSDLFQNEHEPKVKIVNDSKEKNLDIDKSQLKKIVSWLPVLVILFLLAYLAMKYIDEKNTVINETKELSVQEALATIDTLTVDTTKQNREKERDSLRFEFSFLEASLLVANPDSTKNYRFNGKKGQVISLKAKEELNIYVPDGSKIRLNFQDSIYESLSAKNVRINYMIFTKNGIKAKGLSRREQKTFPDTIPTIFPL